MGIFPRWADIDEPERDGKDAEEGDEAFFAPLSRRQAAIEASGDFCAAQPLPRRGENFSHE
jgi:hypothetical protein